MQFRWQRVIYAAIAGLLLMAIGDLLRVQITHRIRVHQADGVWCIIADPGGSVERRYGAANCGE